MRSNESNPEDPDGAFAALFELFSKPTKSPAQAHRTYELSFENGEPIFTLSEISRIVEDAFEEMFGSGEIEYCPNSAPPPACDWRQLAPTCMVRPRGF